MANCLVSFGANLGHAAATIRAAYATLQQQLSATSSELSRLFKTPPVGGPSGQPPFVNAVAAFNTLASPWEVWKIIRGIEHDFGRERNVRWEARKLDVDILLYADQKIWTPQLKIPHPRMCMRRFILAPAVDCAADYVDPVSGLTIAQLHQRVRSQPGSLCVYTRRPQDDLVLLEEAARVTGAQISVQEQSALSGTNRSVHLHDLNKGLGAAVQNLAVFVEHQPMREGAAWEDLYRPLAAQLGLCDSSAPANQRTANWNLSGPRYLLVSEDRQWITHELIAALEAMDCPVEPLSDT